MFLEWWLIFYLKFEQYIISWLLRELRKISIAKKAEAEINASFRETKRIMFNLKSAYPAKMVITAWLKFFPDYYIGIVMRFEKTF